MRFVVDAQLPPRMADWLCGKGHEAVHVAAVLGETASDRAILQYAAQWGAVIVSKDWDFFDLIGDTVRPLLWIGVGNAVNRVLFARLEREWTRIETELNAGVEVVVLKD